MKKTTLALAVVAFSAVSSSAMAWTQSGTGGNPVEFQGTLTPEISTPWEVKVGQSVSDLNGVVEIGKSETDIFLNKSIPVLGIRVADANTKEFLGQLPGSGIVPQVSFDNKVNLSSFSYGVATLNLDVTNDSGVKIGSLAAPFTVAAESTWYDKNAQRGGRTSLYATQPGDAFYGGLGSKSSAVVQQPLSVAQQLDPEFVANYTSFGINDYQNSNTQNFGNPSIVYSAFYGAGLKSGDSLKIILDSPATSDEIQWKATLPVTISYQ